MQQGVYAVLESTNEFYLLVLVLLWGRQSGFTSDRRYSNITAYNYTTVFVASRNSVISSGKSDCLGMGNVCKSAYQSAPRSRPSSNCSPLSYHRISVASDEAASTMISLLIAGSQFSISAPVAQTVGAILVSCSPALGFFGNAGLSVSPKSRYLVHVRGLAFIIGKSLDRYWYTRAAMALRK